MPVDYIVCVNCHHIQGLEPDTQRCHRCGHQFTVEKLMRLMWAWMIRERESAAEMAKDND